MSPEQASGRPVDGRSDIFSLGIVLYESLVGRRPFDGATDLETLQAVIHHAPEPFDRVCPGLPAGLRRVVEKALEKDPARRYQSAHELVTNLHREVRHAPAGAVPALAHRSWRTLSIFAGAALVVATGLFLFRNRPPAVPVATFAQITDLPGQELFPSLAPDGKSVVYQR